VRKQRPQVEVKLIRGSGGQFELVLDGQLVYSKKQTGRFPEINEVMALIPAA
jgi:selenoprotein W-related protein